MGTQREAGSVAAGGYGGIKRRASSLQVAMPMMAERTGLLAHGRAFSAAGSWAAPVGRPFPCETDAPVLERAILKCGRGREQGICIAWTDGRHLRCLDETGSCRGRVRVWIPCSGDAFRPGRGLNGSTSCVHGHGRAVGRVAGAAEAAQGWVWKGGVMHGGPLGGPCV